MSEYASGVNNPEKQEALPGLEHRDVIEAMSPHDRIQEKRRLLEQLSEIEALCNLIDRVNDAEGVNVALI